MTLKQRGHRSSLLWLGVVLVAAGVWYPSGLAIAQGLPNSSNLTLIPHFAIGNGYVTRLFVKNLSTSSNNLVLQFRNQDGSVASTENVLLSPRQTFQRSSGEPSRLNLTAVTQWITIGSDQPIAASVLFDCCAGGSADVVSAVGVLPQARGSAFVAPFIFQRLTATQPVLVEGLGVANPSDRANTITILLLDSNGVQVSSDTLTSIPPFGQTAFTVSDLPNVSARLADRESFLGSLVLTGTQPFSPVIVGNLGGRLFSLPLIATAGTLQASGAPALPASPNLILVPHFAVGGGYVTRVLVKNLADRSNGLSIQFLDQSGSSTTSETTTLASAQIIERSSGEVNRAANLSIQWIAMGSDQPVAASVLFDCCNSGNVVTSAVGVLAQAPGSSFTAPFIFQRPTDTYESNIQQQILVEGLAIANRSDSANTVTIRVLDERGSQVSSDTLAPLGALAQTAFTVSDLPNASTFLTGKNTFLGSIVISGTQPFVPVIVGNLGGRLFSLPLAPQ